MERHRQKIQFVPQFPPPAVCRGLAGGSVGGKELLQYIMPLGPDPEFKKRSYAVLDHLCNELHRKLLDVGFSHFPLLKQGFHFLDRVPLGCRSHADERIVVMIACKASQNILQHFTVGNDEAGFVVHRFHVKQEIQDAVQRPAQEVTAVAHATDGTAGSLDHIRIRPLHFPVQSPDLFRRMLQIGIDEAQELPIRRFRSGSPSARNPPIDIMTYAADAPVLRREPVPDLLRPVRAGIVYENHLSADRVFFKQHQQPLGQLPDIVFFVITRSNDGQLDHMP